MDQENTTYRNGEPIIIWAPTTIHQTARERLAELIRGGGIGWKKLHDPNWRGKPWMDGVLVDLDETDVVEHIVTHILNHVDPDNSIGAEKND